jgi:hypothetical protein
MAPYFAEMAACRNMTNATRSRTVRVGPKSRKKIRIHGPACERGLRTATTPPCDRRAQARIGSSPLLSCLIETARLEVATRRKTGTKPISLGLLRRAHPRKERY